MVSIHTIFKIVLVISIILLAGLILKTELFAGMDNRGGFAIHHRIGSTHPSVNIQWAPEIAGRNTV